MVATSEALRVAILGTGQIGGVHVECARRAGAEVVGVMAAHPDSARRKCRQWNIDRVFESLDHVLSDDKVDVVHVASPNDVHAGQAIAAVEAGKDLPATSIWVCPVCGNTVNGGAPDKCPICGAKAAVFTEV